MKIFEENGLSLHDCSERRGRPTLYRNLHIKVMSDPAQICCYCNKRVMVVR